jgi:hypothetical protein
MQDVSSVVSVRMQSTCSVSSSLLSLLSDLSESESKSGSFLLGS